MDENKQLHQDNDLTDTTDRFDLLHEVISLAKFLCLLIALVWAIHTFVFEGYEVWGPSMLTTLEEGDRIIVFKLPCKLKNLPLIPESWKIHEGDIIVFEGEDPSHRKYIKRVLAMVPSDTPKNIVNASGKSGQEKIHKKVEYHKGKLYINNQLVKEPYLNPAYQESSEEDLVFLNPGEYYVLGDNRKISKDSRYFGPIRENQIVGKAIFRFWPISKIGWL